MNKQDIKNWLDVNVWDGEDRSGAKNDRASFDPDDLQELVEELVQDLAPQWVSTESEVPTDESCMYWVSIAGEVQMMHLNAYRAGSLMWTKWQGFDGNDVSIRYTKYIKIEKPAAQECSDE